MNIKALIFDLGGVVFNYSFTQTFEAWSIFSGIPAHEIRRQIAVSDSFKKFERNDISESEFIESLSLLLNYKFSITTFEEGWNAIYLETRGYIDNLLRNLKNEYRMVALTNTNATHAKIWKLKYHETLKNFEKVFSSYEIRARKPEAKAFQIVINYLKLAPQEILFLDDKEQHIEGARYLDLNVILVTSYNQMRKELKKFNISTI
jgi:glucose-1-phosphatase